MRSDPSKSYIVSEHCLYLYEYSNMHTGSLVCLTGILLDLGNFCNVYNEKTWKKKKKTIRRGLSKGKSSKEKAPNPSSLKAKLDKGTHEEDHCACLREHTRTEGPKDGQIQKKLEYMR